MIYKFFLAAGSGLGALSVMIGAFGAHALRKTLETTGRLETFETAVKYQFYHVFAILVIGLLLTRIQDSLLEWAGYSMMAGILIFSGSLYILSLSGVTKWGAVTPIGGVFFIIGWILMLVAILRSPGLI
jgi:uncharacterized membrane protein YgdD (TMEM256/DUF423 family)